MTERVIVATAGELESIIEKLVRKVISEQYTKSERPGGGQTRLLSIDDAALFLNLAQQTIYGFTSKRMIPFIKKGKRLYFRKEALEEWLNEGKKKTVAEMHKEISETGNLNI